MAADTHDRLESETPAGLVDALRHLGARVVDVQREGRRRYGVVAVGDSEQFARFSLDARDVPALEHEVTVRGIIGAAGALRSPKVVAHGQGWLLEERVGSLPLGGSACVDRIVTTGVAIGSVSLPPPQLRKSAKQRLAARIWALRSPLPVPDLFAARRIVHVTPLPRVTCHGDLHDRNVLYDGSAVWLIDWEYSGTRPAGYDLMQLWSTLENEDDRSRLFEGVVDALGERWRPELRRLRYAVAARMITDMFDNPSDLDRIAQGKLILGLLPALRLEAKTSG